MLKLIAQFLFPSAVGLSPAISILNPLQNAGYLEFNGAVVNPAAFAGALQAFAINAAPATGQTNYAASALGALTLTAIGGLTQLLTAGTAVTVTMDNAQNIVNTIPGPYVGMRFPFTILTGGLGTVATPTVTNTGITLAGITAVLANGARFYQAQITQLVTNVATGVTPGTTFVSLVQIGTTNTYTLTLATNAATSIVGNLIYIGTTVGTLPAGFYETLSAGTTTIVIVAPPSPVAFTASAASMVQPAPPVPITYAPLITITGMYSLSAGVAA